MSISIAPFIRRVRRGHPRGQLRGRLRGGAALVGGLLAVAAAAGPVDAARIELRVEGSPGPFDAGDTVTVGVWMTDLGGTPAAGFQAFLEFDETQLDFVAAGYTSSPFGLPVIMPVVPDANAIDLASGIDTFDGDPPTTADARLATITFVALEFQCTPAIAFRASDPPARISDPQGDAILPLELVAFPPSACATDLDDSGDTGFGDLLVLLANWGGPCPGDFDDSGDVAFNDLLILLAAWGPCPSP